MPEVIKSAPNPQRTAEEDKDVIYVFNRSVWHKPFQFLSAVLLTLAPLPLYFFWFQEEDGDWGKYLSGGMFAIGVAWLLFYLFVTKIQATYRLTEHHCIAELGFISRTIREVEIDHIRNINVHQGLVQRILGIGNVDISSAGSAGVEVCFESVPDPIGVRRKINERARALDNRDNDD